MLNWPVLCIVGSRNPLQRPPPTPLKKKKKKISLSLKMQRSPSSSIVTEELFNNTNTDKDHQELPTYDPASHVAKKERSRLRSAENAIHVIPLVLALCAIVLWFFSTPLGSQILSSPVYFLFLRFSEPIRLMIDCFICSFILQSI